MYMMVVRSFIRKIHLWLSIPFGIFLIVSLLTGAVLVFEKDIVSSADNGGIVSSIGWNNPQPFFKSVMQLHRWLFDHPESRADITLGRLVVGVSTIASSIILISGVFLWFPRKYKSLSSRIKISRKKGLRQFMYSWHITMGIFSVLFLLLMSLTGPVWTFEWYRNIVFDILPESDNIMKTVYALHTGNWGGYIMKTIYCLSALTGVTLILSGYYLWFKRLYHAKHNLCKQERKMHS